MRNPARLQLFRAYISYGLGARERRYVLENCFLVQGHLAQLYRMRVRPVLVDLTREQENRVLPILCRSRGYLTRENLPLLKPYMLKPGRGRASFYNLDDSLQPQWLSLSGAVYS